MDRKLNRIRKSIKTRKMLRHADALHKHRQATFIHDEGRHDLQGDLYGPALEESKKEASFLPSSTFYQFLAAIGLFFLSLFIIKGNHAFLEQPRELLTKAYDESLPFATVYAWYVEHLGEPLPFMPQPEVITTAVDGLTEMPVSGEVIESFQTNGKGIHLLPEKDSYVQAVDKGVVLFAGKNSETGKTITIQHADRSETTYGNLHTIDVHLYQMVQTNEVIGSVKADDAVETFYFSIENKSGYVDPVKVINVDGIQ